MTAIMIDTMGAVPPTVLLRKAQGAFGYSGHNRRKVPAPGYGASLVAAGGLYAIVFEDRANRALDGHQAGVEDATYALHDAALCGYPKGCTIFATADFDASWVAITAYVQGFSATVKAAGYGCGLYADGECIRGAKAAGYISVGWLTCSAGFRGSRDDTGVDIKQRCQGEAGQITIAGYGIDTNYLVTANIGAWGQNASPAPVPYDPPHYPGHLLTPGIKDPGGVTNLKLLLHLAGYKGFDMRAGKIGRFNLGTRLAVARFQHNHNLHTDGIVGPQTWEALRQAVIRKHNQKGTP